jgi:hypothetical protein
VTLSVADHGYAKRAGCAAQFAIERGKRQSPALGQFEIGGIMQYQLEMPGELEGWSSRRGGPSPDLPRF